VTSPAATLVEQYFMMLAINKSTKGQENTYVLKCQFWGIEAA